MGGISTVQILTSVCPPPPLFVPPWALCNPLGRYFENWQPICTPGPSKRRMRGRCTFSGHGIKYSLEENKIANSNSNGTFLPLHHWLGKDMWGKDALLENLIKPTCVREH